MILLQYCKLLKTSLKKPETGCPTMTSSRSSVQLCNNMKQLWCPLRGQFRCSKFETMTIPTPQELDVLRCRTFPVNCPSVPKRILPLLNQRAMVDRLYCPVGETSDLTDTILWGSSCQTRHHWLHLTVHSGLPSFPVDSLVPGLSDVGSWSLKSKASFSGPQTAARPHGAWHRAVKRPGLVARSIQLLQSLWQCEWMCTYVYLKESKKPSQHQHQQVFGRVIFPLWKRFVLDDLLKLEETILHYTVLVYT